jgi:anti-anti-sigma factor
MNSYVDPDKRTLTFRVPGDVLSTNVEILRDESAKLFDSRAAAPGAWATFVLDLTAAKMVDSSGLNLVVSWLKCVQSRGGKMQVVYASPNILRTFAFTRLDTQVELVKR